MPDEARLGVVPDNVQWAVGIHRMVCDAHLSFQIYLPSITNCKMGDAKENMDVMIKDWEWLAMMLISLWMLDGPAV